VVSSRAKDLAPVVCVLSGVASNGWTAVSLVVKKNIGHVRACGTTGQNGPKARVGLSTESQAVSRGFVRR